MLSTPAGPDLDLVLTDLARLDDIQGGLVVSPDGLVMAIHLPSHIAVEPLAALAATGSGPGAQESPGPSGHISDGPCRNPRRNRVPVRHVRRLHRAARRGRGEP